MKRLPKWKRHQLATRLEKYQVKLIGISDQLDGTFDSVRYGTNDSAYDFVQNASMGCDEASYMLRSDFNDHSQTILPR